MFQVKYVWSNTCGGAEREDVDQRSRSETSEQSGADRNNGNKNRKRCDIIAASWRAANGRILDAIGPSLWVSTTTFFGYALCNQVVTCSVSVQVPTLKIDHK
jgi:hypothetical protein